MLSTQAKVAVLLSSLAPNVTLVPSLLTRLSDEAAMENNELLGEAVGYGRAPVKSAESERLVS